jgi:hypothetical protein
LPLATAKMSKAGLGSVDRCYLIAVSASVCRGKRFARRQALTFNGYAKSIRAPLIFRATGKGWQTRMNDAIKDWLTTHSPV